MRNTVIGLAAAAAIITAGSTLSASAHDYGGGMRSEGYDGHQGEHGRGEYRREFERRGYPHREFSRREYRREFERHGYPHREFGGEYPRREYRRDEHGQRGGYGEYRD